MQPVSILVFMGTAGCGKTSVAEGIQKALNCEYLEGDLLHPAKNVEKMSLGKPLDDDDRWPWLEEITINLVQQAKKVQDLDVKDKRRVVVVTCSALKKVYRDVLRKVPESIGTVIFVYLKGSQELLLERIQGRKGHFMAAEMLQSQLNTLEEPDETTERVIVVSIEPSPQEIVNNIIKKLIEKGYICLE